MDRVCAYLESPIGRKVQVAAAGLLLCGFLVTHLAGNLFLLAGPESFNHYAHTLASNPLLPLAEAALAALFLLHIISALRVRHLNRKARPIGYAVAPDAGARTPGSRSMLVSGILVLAFLFVHLKSFRFAPDRTDLYKVVVDAFASRGYTVFYIVAMVGLGLHLSHGFQSAFQTFGLNHKRYTPLIKAGGLLFAFVFAGGFAGLAVWGALQTLCP